MKMQSTDTRREGTQLEFEDHVTIPTTKARLWGSLSDPAFLASCFPGAESVERVSAEKYSVKVVRGIGGLTLSVTGDIEYVEVNEPDWLIAEGTAYEPNTHAVVEGAAAMELNERDDRTVELAYKAVVTFTGGTAALTPKLIRSIVEQDVDRYFANVKSRVEGES